MKPMTITFKCLECESSSILDFHRFSMRVLRKFEQELTFECQACGNPIPQDVVRELHSFVRTFNAYNLKWEIAFSLSTDE